MPIVSSPQNVCPLKWPVIGLGDFPFKKSLIRGRKWGREARIVTMLIFPKHQSFPKLSYYQGVGAINIDLISSTSLLDAGGGKGRVKSLMGRRLSSKIYKVMYG